jgi:hypothetical protein
MLAKIFLCGYYVKLIAFGLSIDIWRPDLLVSITNEVIPANFVGQEKDDVGLWFNFLSSKLHGRTFNHCAASNDSGKIS